jgi:manganese/zinc/iron transport system substrate-binding protein
MAPTKLWVWLVVGVALLPAGCSSGEGTRGKYPIRVVCTTGMVADLVQHVGGEYVAVSTLMGEGVDPHLYKPGTGDVEAMDGADVIFYSGCHLEGKMGEVFASMARRKSTLGIADALDEKELLGGEGGYHDPHLWFDVALWSQTLEPIRAALAKYDPPHAETYKKNAEAYRVELMEVDAWARAELAKVPKSQRVLVTAHDAFRYFGRAYDV